jgi:magnesium transporter
MPPTGRTCLIRKPDGQLAEVDLSTDDLSQLKAEPGHLTWLDLADPDSDDLALLRDRLHLHPLAIEDLEKRSQRPKIDTYPDQHVLVAYEVMAGKPDAKGLVLGELHLIAGKEYLVSVHWRPSPTIEDVRERWRQHADAVATTAGGLLYAILDAVADGYFPLLDRLSERIDRLQDRIIAGGPDKGQGTLRDVLKLKRELLELRRAAAPLRDVANALLRRDVVLIDDELTPYFQDLYDHLVRVLDTVDLDREMLASALDANLSVTNNNLNVVVKRLTAFTVILMVPTLIAGVYGMNFRYMPELSWPLGYALALGLMAISMFGVYLFFRARDWF